MVFSTWAGELESHPLNLDRMAKNGFVSEETTEPKVVVWGHYLHQIYRGTDKNSALHSALIGFLRENSLFKFALFLERYLLHTHFLICLQERTFQW